ncbi:hypothetical protein Q3G72_000347 [Acer saccharum]|nr:hypothetical protein Q3G72_000347 [Acer saccharum]
MPVGDMHQLACSRPSLPSCRSSSDRSGIQVALVFPQPKDSKTERQKLNIFSVIADDQVSFLYCPEFV